MSIGGSMLSLLIDVAIELLSSCNDYNILLAILFSVWRVNFNPENDYNQQTLVNGIHSLKAPFW
jgi:hypothetical protein